MADYILVRHRVRDYSVWKPAYDADLPRRSEAGLTERYLLRGADDPDNVFILFEAEDLARAKAFAESPGLREVMDRVGVVDEPDMYLLSDTG